MGVAGIPRPEPVDDAKQDEAAGDKDAEEHGGIDPPGVEDIADREQGRPDGQRTGDPADDGQRKALAAGLGLGFADPRLFPDLLPARAERPDLLVERDERLAVGFRPEVGGQHPADRRHRDREDEGVMGGDEDAELAQDEDQQREDERRDHGVDFAPGVDPPPEPADEIKEARSGPDLEDDVERVFGRIEDKDHRAGGEEQDDRGQPADEDVVLFGRRLVDEAAVEVVNEVGRAPVEVGQIGRGVGRDEAADHQADEADGQELEHGRVGDVVADEARVEIGEGLLDVRKLGEDDDRGQPDEDPGPRPEDVVGDVEEEDGAERVLLGLRGQHALGDVAAAAGLGPRVPDRPPLDGQGHDEDGDGQVPIALEVRQHAQEVDAAGTGRRRELGDQGRHAADGPDGEVGRRDDRGHLDEELDHVDDQDAPEAGDRGEDDVEDADEEERLPAIEPEEDGGDLAGGQIDRGHDDAVEEEAEVDRAKAADDAGGLARIAELVELEVGQDLGAAPHPGVKEDGRDAGQGEGPPDPVARDAVAADDVGDQVRRVAAERRGHHGEAGQPPGHGPARSEELGGALARALAEEQGGAEADQQDERDDDPVEELKVHGYRPFAKDA